MTTQCKVTNSRKGWADYYAKVYERTKRPSALHMSMWYELLHEAFGE